VKRREIYVDLKNKLSLAPSGVPEGDRFLEILGILFTPEEAILALTLPFMPASALEISEASGIDPNKVNSLLMNMANKGLVYTFMNRDTRMFLLFSLDTIYNYPIKYKRDDVDQGRLRSLWSEYLQEGSGHPPGTYLPPGRVLPVEEELKPESGAVSYDLVYRYIDEAKYLSVGDCSCRKIVKACDNPIETCIGVGYAAKFLVEQGLSRRIEKGEAKEIVKMAHDAGLVSIPNNTKENIGIICHCCPCCCAQLGVATKHGRYDLRPVGSFLAVVDRNQCTACELCVDTCPMKAISVEETASSDPEKCIGCGLCISACQEKAISLTSRTPPIKIPDNIMDYTIEAVKTQGTVDGFMKELTIKKGNKRGGSR
jgi:Na+-translocating ferredoxin:NAD+ oxidoreductase subunit B